MLELSDKNFKAAMKKATMINMLKANGGKTKTEWPSQHRSVV